MKMGRYGYQSVEGAVDGSREVVSSQLFIIVDLLLYFRHTGYRQIHAFRGHSVRRLCGGFLF